MKTATSFPPKLLSTIILIFCFFINSILSEATDSVTPCELEQILSELVYPEAGYELHAAALRNQLRNLIEKQAVENYQPLDDVDSLLGNYEKRSIATLAREGHLKAGKRNIGSLARSGLLREYIKRSLATLAKNGHLPSTVPSSKDPDDVDEDSQSAEKRSISPLVVKLARNSIYTGRRPLKINSYAKANQLMPQFGKRNVGNLARDWMLPNQKNHNTEKREAKLSDTQAHRNGDKRNIGSLKNSPVHGGKHKREVSYSIIEDTNPELIESNYQSTPFDYEELAQAMDDAYPWYYKTNDEKRYLGSLMRSGFRSGYRAQMNKRYLGALARTGMLRRPDKRHIGAVFRSGWLPAAMAFRPIRGGRFSRSGRARPNITPHTTNSASPYTAEFVDAVIPDTQTQLTGTQLDYLAQHGDQHHLESQHSIGENFDLNPYYPHQLTDDTPSNDNKQDIMFNFDSIDLSDLLENVKQRRCYQRLKDLYLQILNDNDVTVNDLTEGDLF